MCDLMTTLVCPSLSSFPVKDREKCRQMGSDRAHLVEAAAAACECHSDLAVHKAANTEAYKQIMNHTQMITLWHTSTNKYPLKGLQSHNDDLFITNQVIPPWLLLPFHFLRLRTLQF